MNNSIVKKAWDAYKSHDYEKSLIFYRDAGRILGEDFFAHNIYLCEKNIKSKSKSKSKSKKKTKDIVLTLLDPISELCWGQQYYGYPLSKAKYEEQISGSKAKFAFFESAWKANRGSWEYAFTSPGLKHPNAKSLISSIELLKSKNIPIIFWNKEDPMHFNMFLPIAKMVDYVFTTDSLSVPNYKKQLGHENVFALPFAAPIETTNPSKRFDTPSETVCFAGTYYAQNHEDRKIQMDAILPSIVEFDGVIYDRASSIGGERYSYPEQYHEFIRPAIQFDEMTQVYKRFEVFLNVNTITKSPTMMSRRVYELLASGTPVVSTPSKSIAEQFPGIVLTVANEDECNAAVNKLITDKFFWCQQSQRGIREVMTKHTYTQRWGEVMRCVSGLSLEEDVESYSLVIEHKSDSIFRKQIEIIADDDISYKEIYVISSNAENSKIIMRETDLSGKKQRVDISFLNNINELSIERLSGDYFAYFSGDTIYSRNYLSDQALPFSYGKDIVATVKCKVFDVADIELGELSKLKKSSYTRWHSLSSTASLSHSLIKLSKINDLNIDWKSGLIESNELSPIYNTDFFNVLSLQGKYSEEDLRNILYKNINKVSL